MAKLKEKYYTVYEANAKKGTVAKISVQIKEELEIIDKIEKGELDEFPVDFMLHSCYVTDQYYEGDLTDEEPEELLNSSISSSLLSERLKEIISSELKGTEHIRWIKATIKGVTKSYTYYAMLFTKYLDVLDRERSTYVVDFDHLMNPFYKQLEAEKYAVFHRQGGGSWQLPFSFIVNDAIKKKIRKAKLQGIVLDPVRRIL